MNLIERIRKEFAESGEVERPYKTEAEKLEYERPTGFGLPGLKKVLAAH